MSVYLGYGCMKSCFFVFRVEVVCVFFLHSS